MNFKKGFTLIELLVVVAIIGILASVVLASLNSARAKGSDAAVKANMSGIRANAELQYDNAGGCYTVGGNCSSTPAVLAAGTCATAIADTDSIFALASITAQLNAADAAGGLCAAAMSANGASWAAAVQYKSDDKKAWCVDSLGTSKEVTLADNAQATLNAAINDGGTPAVVRCD